VKATARKRICFVTGTRAEYGLMRSTLAVIAQHPSLELQLVATGMHLHRRYGRTIDEIRRDGWTVDATVPWPLDADTPAAVAARTGAAMAKLAATYERLQTDVVLVVGDRVEAFAAAAAGQVSQRVVAHVHGGDRAAGQIDDALRHAITKLAHVHFPATPASAARIVKLGEDPRRIHRVGAPGIDGIATAAAPMAVLRERFPGLREGQFALIVLHPTDATGETESSRASTVLRASRAAGIEQVVVIYPNSDPGSQPIIRCWEARQAEIDFLLPDAPRDVFLGLMRRCAVMVGNSSAGIIEAGALGTPVVNVGDRQAGRERGANVADVGFRASEITLAVRSALSIDRTGRPDKTHPYGGGRAGVRIAAALDRLMINNRLLRKLIAY
jgi:UDP-hydrolysing UDP-N-acetyl-D-glucosamine 2-epimerase